MFVVDDIAKPFFEFDVAGGVDFAFEDRILDALAVVEADFGRAAQALFSADGGGGDEYGAVQGLHREEPVPYPGHAADAGWTGV